MNILQDTSIYNSVDQREMILPFYRMEDIEALETEEISIDTFEEYANYRMKCRLKWGEDSVIVYLQLDQNELNPSNPDSNVKAREGAIVMKKDRVRLGRGTNAKEKDLISHFIMRAAFAFTKGDQVKFIERESRLFELSLSGSVT